MDNNNHMIFIIGGNDVNDIINFIYNTNNSYTNKKFYLLTDCKLDNINTNIKIYNYENLNLFNFIDDSKYNYTIVTHMINNNIQKYINELSVELNIQVIDK